MNLASSYASRVLDQLCIALSKNSIYISESV